MAKSAVWRITAVDTQGRDLVLSRLRLLASSTRVDSGAVLTCTAGLVSGSLSDLLEDSADSCMFAAVDVSAPGFQFVFTLPAEQEVDGVELGLVGSTTAPVALTLECVESGRFVTVKEFRGIETSGAPVAVQVGEVASGSQEQGYIVALRSGSARPQLNAFDRAAATWAENFAQTIDIGLFANAGTNPGDTGVLATKVVNQFALEDSWALYAFNGTWYGDVAQIDIEFLRADASTVAAVRLARGSDFSTEMFYGASLSSMSKAALIGPYGWPDGILTFSAGSMVWTPKSGATNNHVAWQLVAPMSSVVAVRFSNARAASNYSLVGSAVVTIKRESTKRRSGYTGDLPYKSTKALRLAVVSSTETPSQDVSSCLFVGSSKFHDLEFGGRGFLFGTVRDDKSKAVLQRRVRLFRSRDGLLVRETWSAADGSYRFDGISDRYEYDIEAWDHEKNYFTAVANSQLPEVSS